MWKDQNTGTSLWKQRLLGFAESRPWTTSRDFPFPQTFLAEYYGKSRILGTKSPHLTIMSRKTRAVSLRGLHPSFLTWNTGIRPSGDCDVAEPSRNAGGWKTVHKSTWLLILRVYGFVIWRRNRSSAQFSIPWEPEFQASLFYGQTLYLAIGSHHSSRKRAFQAKPLLASWRHLLPFRPLVALFLHSAMLRHRAARCQECSVHALPVDGLISFFRSCLQRGLSSVSISLLLILVVGRHFCTIYHSFNYLFIYSFFCVPPMRL